MPWSFQETEGKPCHELSRETSISFYQSKKKTEGTTTLAFAMFADLPKQKVGKHVPKYLLLGIKTKLFGTFGGFFSLRQKLDPSDLILFRIKGSCSRNLNTLQAVVVVVVVVVVVLIARHIKWQRVTIVSRKSLDNKTILSFLKWT